MSVEALPAVECVTDPARASALLDPLRLSILEQAREPASASDIASRLGLPRQRVNYHTRELARAGFLTDAGRRKKRNLMEHRWRATARAYVISPKVLGGVAPDEASFQDRFSAETLLARASQLSGELTTARAEADEQGKRLATLSVSAEVRFRNAKERAAFARDLEAAVLDVVARHAWPEATGKRSRLFRLLVGCWPIPPAKTHPEEKPR